tara:strand:+ start:176 stop:487 length:312 start_codon:yes stop_codon:yes gene_type:complete
MTNLIEQESKYLIRASLKEMHSNRIQSYYNILNIVIFGLFSLICILVLYNCNINQLTPHEKAQKMLKEQQYILSKIHEVKQDSLERSQITNLPSLNTIHQYNK